MILVLAHSPRHERTALPLRGRQRFELLADAELRLVADLKHMTAPSSIRTALLNRASHRRIRAAPSFGPNVQAIGTPATSGLSTLSIQTSSQSS